MNATLRLVLANVFAVSVVLGCSKPQKPSADLAKTKILHTDAQVETIDPHLITGSPAWDVVAALGETLVRIDYKTMNIVPAAAHSWRVSDDGLVFTFDLRPGAKWSNGDPLSAHDFVYSWRRILSPALGNQYATDYYAIKGAKAFHQGLSKSFSSVGVRALSDLQLQFSLGRVDPLFLRRVAAEPTAPVNKKVVESHGAMDDPATPGPERAGTWAMARFAWLSGS